MKYNIGDKVKVKSLDWYNKNKDDCGYIFSCGIYFIPKMSIFCGCVMTINAIDNISDNVIYHVEENSSIWTEDMFEGLAYYKENMENIEITLNDKNYIIDVEKAKELGVLKEKDSRCKSWDEFREKYKNKQGFCYNDVYRVVGTIEKPIMTSEQLTETEAIAIITFSKLLKLRRDWIGDWKPDWSKSECKLKYCIVVKDNSIIINSFYLIQHTFSFPTKEMAKEFLECFRNLFEQCKNLI